MEWLNINARTLDSPQFIGADPVQRATWLCLLRYCIGQENGGTITDCRAWGDRRWQQLVRITADEVSAESELWSWSGDSLTVFAYPLDKERLVRDRRDHGAAGGSARGGRKAEAARINGQAQAKQEAKQNPSKRPSNNPSKTQATTQRKGMEGKGMEGNGKELESLAPLAPARDGGSFMHEAMDCAERDAALSRAMAVPAGAPATDRRSPAAMLADLRIAFPAVWIGRDERAEWLALLEHYEWEPIEDACRTLGADMRKRLFLSDVASWTAAHYKPVQGGAT